MSLDLRHSQTLEVSFTSLEFKSISVKCCIMTFTQGTAESGGTWSEEVVVAPPVRMDNTAMDTYSTWRLDARQGAWRQRCNTDAHQNVSC